MNVYYNVEIQMIAKHTLTVDLLERILPFIGAKVTDVDEHENHRASIFFKSEDSPTKMHDYVRNVLHAFGDRVHYIDVIYRWEWELNCDRFVIWSDGCETEYTGHITFEEDK